MHDYYEDIRSRINEEPSWYDEHGTPRYGGFSPENIPNIYAQVVGLFRIECQYCQDEFIVEMSAMRWDTIFSYLPKKWHYGDPPAHRCTGDTMNCIDREVIEFWRKDRHDDWVRDEDFEGYIDENAWIMPEGDNS